ncbi:MAG: chemotaxis protein CheD [Deltaproteobacteria bacterium]|nr:chemotaxis protein CheD [Deltaproteobacteria bacterium]
MFSRSEKPVASNYFLKPGYILIPRRPTVISTVLGSCVAVCLYDRKTGIGGMNHFKLPRILDSDATTACYGNVATLALIDMMIQDGCRIKDMEAQVFGGAFNPSISSRNIGEENTRIARRILSRKGIRIVSEDVGGERGRKIVFDTGTNEVVVLKVEKLRMGDWFPYQGQR